ncbi:hypothetical protein NPIL_274471 [Nephila pilipes]|uniref:Uncharacterized protein n=1 Tax=Nephila pilipes TaxID=299642 RepID=A0A8X6NNL1_NEPPI|nr:hypothetical protein NPIL_274471 [Nephila pilipes]
MEEVTAGVEKTESTKIEMSRCGAEVLLKKQRPEDVTLSVFPFLLEIVTVYHGDFSPELISVLFVRPPLSVASAGSGPPGPAEDIHPSEIGRTKNSQTEKDE